MGDMALDAKTALTEATARLDRLENQFNKMGTFPAASNESGTQNNATWNVNAGGAGVWIATTACLMMLVMNVILGFLYLDLRRESARTADYQQTEYMLIPDLKKLVDEEIAKRKEK